MRSQEWRLMRLSNFHIAIDPEIDVKTFANSIPRVRILHDQERSPSIILCAVASLPEHLYSCGCVLDPARDEVDEGGRLFVVDVPNQIRARERPLVHVRSARSCL
jgi:hypothetical protein